MTHFSKMTISLPEDIINLIYEFSPEHREKFKKVLNEYNKKCICSNCGEIKMVSLLYEKYCSFTCDRQDDSSYYSLL